MDFIPAGTATSNQDAVRQAPISQFFYNIADVMAGVDSQPRMEPGNVNNSGLVGPSPTFGVDIGIGQDGQVYARGRTGTESNASQAAAQGASSPNASQLASGPKVSPLLMLGLVVAAWFAFK